VFVTQTANAMFSSVNEATQFLQRKYGSSP
jgi:hypothetical protein